MLVRVALPIAAVVFRRIGGGAIWMKMLVRMLLPLPVEVFVLFLVLCSLFKGLSSGVLFLLCKLMMGYILGFTISVLSGMLAASWNGKTASRPAALVKDGDLILLSVVNHECVAGHALDPLVWSAGGAPKRRRVVHAVRDRAFLPGPAGIWDGEWGVVAVSRITCNDVELWPNSVSRKVGGFSVYSSLASLVSRPRKVFLNELLVLFGNSSGSAAALLNGELPLRYCSGKFACRLPTWGLPSCGHVQGLVAEFAGIEEVSWGGPVALARQPGLVGGAGVLRGRRILGRF